MSKIRVYESITEANFWQFDDDRAIVKFDIGNEVIAVRKTEEGTLEIHGEGSALVIVLGAANDFEVKTR